MSIDTVLIAAILTLLGVIITQGVVAYTNRKQHKLAQEQMCFDRQTMVESHQLASLNQTVEVLKSEYERLVRQVEDLRAEIEVESRSRRLVEEKYSVSLSFVGSLLGSATVLFSRLDADGVPHAPLPRIPPLLELDLYHRWPELKEYTLKIRTDAAEETDP